MRLGSCTDVSSQLQAGVLLLPPGMPATQGSRPRPAEETPQAMAPGAPLSAEIPVGYKEMELLPIDGADVASKEALSGFPFIK